MIDIKTFRRKLAFHNTQRCIRRSYYLKARTMDTIRKTDFYSENRPIFNSKQTGDGIISVTAEDTITAALRVTNTINGRTAILNFASPTSPGGGVTRGISAQEEDICRCTNLYPVLNTEKNKNRYYRKNACKINELLKHTDQLLGFEDICKAAIGTDAIIYTPNIVIVKKSELSKPLQRFDQKLVDVITCAAPDIRHIRGCRGNACSENFVLSKEYYIPLKRRVCRIFEVAADNGVRNLILGAFGCGVFQNPVGIVARAFKEACDEYKGKFDNIIFAIPDENSLNYSIFRDKLL